MELPYFIIFVFVIFALIALKVIIRDKNAASWKTVFETNSRVDGLALRMRTSLNANHVRTRLIYKGPPNSPYIGMAGEQIVAVQVHIEDLGMARPIVSKILNEDWRGRF